MLQLFSYKMGNFYKKNFRKKSIPSWCKEGKYPQKGAPKATVALGASLFCPRHPRVNINENQIWSNCSVIKWETFIRKIFEKKYSLLAQEGKYPQKGAPKATVALGASLFCSRHQKVRKNLIFIHPQDEGPRGLQILSPSRILLYYRGASFNITLSKLVNSPFKHNYK